MNDTVPRGTDGYRLHHIGRAFYVLLDALGQETSNRVPGEFWIGFHDLDATYGDGMSGDIIIIPDDTDKDGLVALRTRDKTAAWLAYGLEDRLVYRQGIFGGVQPHRTYLVEWAGMLGAMR